MHRSEIPSSSDRPTIIASAPIDHIPKPAEFSSPHRGDGRRQITGSGRRRAWPNTRRRRIHRRRSRGRTRRSWLGLRRDPRMRQSNRRTRLGTHDDTRHQDTATPRSTRRSSPHASSSARQTRQAPSTQVAPGQHWLTELQASPTSLQQMPKPGEQVTSTSQQGRIPPHGWRGPKQHGPHATG